VSAVTTLSELRRARPSLLDEGAAPARRRAQQVDAVVRALAADRPLAAIAVGGYGRGELSPHSDIDVLIVHRGAVQEEAVRDLLYPLWDAGFGVGHAVCTPAEAIDRAEQDLASATALLNARRVGGDEKACTELLDRRELWIKKARRAVAARLIRAVHERHAARARAGWALAPDLKEDAGALRDVHVLEWLELIGYADGPSEAAAAAAAVMTATREALHAQTSRKHDRLHIEIQPSVAAALSVELDDLMTSVHAAAREIEHELLRELTWAQQATRAGPRRSGAVRSLRPGVALQDNHLVADPAAPPLEVAVAYAETGRRPDPDTVAALRRAFTEGGVFWDEATRRAFVDLLRAPHAPAALELLDHVGGMTFLVPGWAAVRGRAQHDPYHRYTADGHSFAAVGDVSAVLRDDPVAQGAAADDRDATVLYIGTLLHDIGKGSGRDHSIVGSEVAQRVCRHMGLPPDDVADIATLVRLHLLLPDTATRRDLDDGAVIADVAAKVSDPRLLKMLYVLAAADGRATGPAAWSDWKATLVRKLYGLVLHALETGEVPDRFDVAARAAEVAAFDPGLAEQAGRLLDRLPPSYLSSVPVDQMAAELQLLAGASGGVRHSVERVEDHVVLSAAVPNRTGALAVTAGVLALSRISILSAQAYSAGNTALQRLVVSSPPGLEWSSVGRKLEAAHTGRLSLEADVERKAADHASVVPSLEVRFSSGAGSSSTVVEVRARDAIGLLYAVTAAIGDLGLDIHTAKIDTRGERVVDVFYVRSSDGAELDEAQQGALRRAAEHRVARLFGGVRARR